MSRQPWAWNLLLAAVWLASLGCETNLPAPEETDSEPAAVLQAAAAEPEELRLTPEQVTALYGTQEAVGTLMNAERVEAYRLVEGPAQGTAADFKASAGPLLLTRSMAGEFAAVLTDPDTFWWDTAKGCEPRYGVRLKFMRGDSAVDVLLCLDCRSLAVYAGSDPPRSKDFDGAAPRIIGLVKQLFPYDAGIQGLP